ncbi:MAG TPA: hypothetical protein VHX16_14750 [Chloroflexota bacterium]|jgi:hypothetical protein|nr:hypothetical protein [Chloroflexota bacterium]
MMDDEWSPTVGDRVYVSLEQRAGQVVSIDPDGATIVYRIELDRPPGSEGAGRSTGWGDDSLEQVSCTLDELTGY